MPAMTNLLVKDDAATPTTWTLEPIQDSNGESIWRSAVSTAPIEGQVRLTATTVQLKSGVFKTTAKLEVPVMETLGASGSSVGYVAPPKVAYVTTAIFTMFADKRSTAQDRANAFRLLMGCLQGATSTVDTGTLANNALGQVWLNSAAPMTALMTKLIRPN